MHGRSDIRGRIASVKNIRKITRAMEMISAARLRRAEQRIEALRPYADALRRMTSRASQAASNIPNLPILQEKDNVQTVGILLVTGDRGLAGPFNSQIAVREPARGRAAADGRRALVPSGAARFLDGFANWMGGSWTGFKTAPLRRRARHCDGLTSGSSTTRWTAGRSSTRKSRR